MAEKKRFLILVFVMVLVAFVVGVGGVVSLYNTAFEQQRERLSKFAQNQARLIEAMVRYDVNNNASKGESVGSGTIAQLKDANSHFVGFEKTCEFVLAKRQGDKIQFILSSQHPSEEHKLLAFSSKLAEPMTRALQGHSGTLLGKDYRGITVLAAYEPIKLLGFGVVAKIDLSEIRAPYVRTGLFWVFFAILFVSAGILLFYRVGNPILEKIRENERDLSITLNAIGDGVISTDTQGRITRMNPVAEKLTGWSLNEAYGLDLDQVFHSVHTQTGELLENPVKKVFASGKVEALSYHTTLISKTGERFQISDSGGPIRYPGGRMVGMVLVFRDISAEYAAIENLKASKEIAQRYLDIAGVMIVALNREGDITLINKKGCEILGFEHRELIGQNWFLLCLPDRMKKDIKKVFGQLMMGNIRPVEYYENSVVRKDGQERMLAFHNSVIRDLNGNIVNILSSGEDITQRKEAEKALALSEERFRTIYENAPVMINSFDVDGRCLLWNRQCERDMGYTLEEVQSSEDPLSWCYPDPSFREQVRKWIVEADGVFRESYLHTKSGIQRIHQWAHFKMPSGQLFSVGIDVTDKKSAEKELMRTNRALKALSKISDAMMRSGDEKTFLTRVCRLIVEAGYRLSWVGFVREDETKKIDPIAQYGYEEGYLETLDITWSDEARGRGPTGTAVRTGEPAMARHILTDPNFEPWRYQALKRGYASSLALPLIFDKNIVGVLNLYALEADAFDDQEVDFLKDLANDIAFALNAFHQGVISERLRIAVEHTDDVVVITDSLGEIQYVNNAFQKEYGYLIQEIVGKNVDILKSDAMKKTIIQEMWGVLEIGEAWKGRFANRTRDGSLFEVDASISPIKDREGMVSNYVGVFRDITKDVQMEGRLRQAQKMEAIGTLTGGISHDFNNLLGVMLGYTELLLNALPKEEQPYRDLQEVFKAGLRAKDLVSQLLTYSRQSEEDKKPIQVVPILKETMKFLRSTLPSTLTIETHIETEGCVVFADATQLHQVIMNLCTNAGHAMEGSRGCLLVSLTLKTLTVDVAEKMGLMTSGEYVCISVEDTGVGMSTEVQDRIFDPFYTSKEVGRGTGLGLSVVLGIVKDSGGAVEFESLVGSGSLFRVYLPIVKTAAIPVQNRAFPAPKQGNHRILFVDDEEGIATLGRKQLEAMGYRVRVFLDPRKALAYFKKDPNRFNVVISDQTMPGMTGLELARKIKKLNPEVPFILCSGAMLPVFSDDKKEQIPCFYLNKPVLVEALASMLSEVLPDS